MTTEQLLDLTPYAEHIWAVEEAMANDTPYVDEDGTEHDPYDYFAEYVGLEIYATARIGAHDMTPMLQSVTLVIAVGGPHVEYVTTGGDSGELKGYWGHEDPTRWLPLPTINGHLWGIYEGHGYEA